jgi:salicylate hydroxylase
VFLAPRTHLVAYPLEGGKSINMVAITKRQGSRRDLGSAENPASDRIARCLWRLAPGPRHSREAPRMTWWPLFEMPDGRWFDGDRTMLIGDAAHAMTPFAAQGAAMAIEDGYELAQASQRRKTAISARRLQRYESHRRIRIGRARSRAAFNQFAYHARGPIRLGRNIVLDCGAPKASPPISTGFTATVPQGCSKPVCGLCSPKAAGQQDRQRRPPARFQVPPA